MTSNSELFKNITTLNGVSLEESIDGQFNASLTAFRGVTSKPYQYNGQTYPAVYLSDNSYGGLVIHFGDGETLSLIMNLEFYYVYGFFYRGTVYAFKDEAYEGLSQFGFDCCIQMSFGDSYTEIQQTLGWEKADALRAEQATLTKLTNSLKALADQSIAFQDKCAELLIVFWSLVEGIRFAAISNSVNDQINGTGTGDTYQTYHDLAEKWADLSVDAAKKGILNPAIAVYELHRIEHLE